MNRHRHEKELPVRRKLLAGSVAYLSGIYLTGMVCLPGEIVWILSALFLSAGVIRLARRKSALVCILAFLALFGNWRAAQELGVRDTATEPGVLITGTVSRIISDTRVYLSDVRIEGERVLARPAVVTLMPKEDEEGNPIPSDVPVSIGQRISGTGRLFEQNAVRNPGGVDWRINALCDGYELSGYLVPGWSAQGDAVFSIAEAFRQMKVFLSARIARLFGEQAPLFQAVMIGDRSQMDGELVQAMRLTGIAHLLTVSGMHLTLIAQAVRRILQKLRLRRWSMFALQALLLGAFACLTGGAAGTIRAYIMAMIRELAAHTGRRYDSLTSLAAAALIMTLIEPVWALNASFQFSFFVVLGILLLNGEFAAPIDRLKSCPDAIKRMGRGAALSVSAQLAAVPMQLALYGYIPLLALPMNLLCGMLMPFIMLGGWGLLLVSFLLPGQGASLAGLLGGFAGVLENLSISAASHDWGIFRMPAPYMLSLLVVAALMFAASHQIYVKRGRVWLCALLAAALGLLYVPRLDSGAKYVQLDVGQGDGAVVRSGRQAVLIDVGPEDEYAALRYLRYEGLSVDLVILSHLDEDHAGALGVLLDSEIRVNRIAMAEGALEEAGSQAVLDALNKARDMGVAIETYDKGDTIAAGEFSFCVLSPDDALSGSNERSLVLYGEVDGMRLLTLGDLPADCEMEDVPPCDILKVAHHGSRYATSRALLEQAKPAAALISVGRNSYGHPTDRVLLDLEEVGARVFRTDHSGCLTAARDGESIVISTFIK